MRARPLSSDLTMNGNLFLNSDFGVGGNTVMTSGDLVNAQTLTIGSGMVNVNGDFDGTGAAIDFTGAGHLRLGGTVTSLGTLDSAQGTVLYSKAGGPIHLVGQLFQP